MKRIYTLWPTNEPAAFCSRNLAARLVEAVWILLDLKMVKIFQAVRFNSDRVSNEIVARPNQHLTRMKEILSSLALSIHSMKWSLFCAFRR